MQIKTNRIRAKQQFGQHFLVDQSVLQNICQTLAPKAGQNVLEIGPGTGALTRLLLATEATITAVEIDNDLIRALQKRWPQLKLIHKNILELDISGLFTDLPTDAPSKNSQWRLVGNLPYNISTQILARLPALRMQIQDALFMVQEEVALRLAASPGNKQWGRLGVLMQHSFDVEMLFEVPPDAFRPKPAVQSRMVYLKPKQHVEEIIDKGTFSQVVRAAFNQRRKTLANALKPLASEFVSLKDPAKLLLDLKIMPNRRAEELSLQEFARLANRVAAQEATQNARAQLDSSQRKNQTACSGQSDKDESCPVT